MSCGDLPTLDIKDARNADLRRTYTPPFGFTFDAFTARMQVRASQGDPTLLLNVSMSPTANGSVFTLTGGALILTIKKADLALLPVADPISEPVTLWYDIILTGVTGLESYFLGGAFVLFEGVTR